METFLTGILRASSLFGIYIYPKPITKKGRKLHLLLRLYPWLVMFLSALSTIYAISQTYFDTKIIISVLVWSMVFVAQKVAHVVIMLEAMLKRKQHECFLHKLAEVDASLKLRLRYREPTKRLLRHLRVKYLAIVLVLVLTLILYTITAYFSFEVIIAFHGIASVLTMHMCILQLIFYLEYLHNFLEVLNWKLRQLVTRKCGTDSEQLMDIDYGALESIAYLQALQQIYVLTIDAFRLWNNIAGWSLLCNIACYILDITCHTYWVFLAMNNLDVSSHVYKFWIMNFVPMSLMLYTICQGANDCKIEADIFRKLVNRLINTTASCKKRYKDLIFEFSLQLQHGTISITANHFFNVDKKLIMTVYVAILTYLIILIQFLKSDDGGIQ